MLNSYGPIRAVAVFFEVGFFTFENGEETSKQVIGNTVFV